ncbi:hypothetical protein HDU76_000302, partial [Blyttiomyces sp. JEL0837]
PQSTFRYPDVVDPRVTVIPFTADETNDTVTRELGTFLKNMYGNYSLIPNENRTVSIETAIGGTPWIINYRFLDRPNNWIVVVGIPRSDFFGKIDTAKTRATIIVCSLAAIGAIIAGTSSWLAMRPLHTLTTAMKKLTKRDFAALEGEILNQRSFMRELREVQVAFASMCKAFSKGLRQNKALMAATARRKGSGGRRPLSSGDPRASSEKMPSSSQTLPTSSTSLATSDVTSEEVS